ncbi:ICEBs1 excisionase [Bacillus atrophaeus]|uniref:ICEBs1 excisionase n=1 Tax=Bacillus atrophaeus TaxID=1452 RepID=UPI002DB90604|nr:ICEBs1 excisionase [Bacillus atrophaeus]MEC1900707.1 ICEBs1 excisionase [Bacillus atrophaeus]MEC2396542.1 ICEBs1 excisionase [Bacillus atrophaeus]MED4436197.1 ICEBs1 excisionase [Bacillus atrophaeus]MED4563803.1 ICEBs1 excisionase [Bacillus atrophaeus]MED4575156.1 ICEBs1 excisionase [Bacillus atrophaeus]
MGEFLKAHDIQKILGVKQAKAYSIIRELNSEMEEAGYKVIKGRLNKAKFEERFFYQRQESKTG